MRHLAAFVLLVLAGCANTPGAQTASLPSGARVELSPKWVQEGAFRWPPQNGFDGAVTYLVLPAGVLLDRFGSDQGRFFSPKGASFGARALPTVCTDLVYSVYRVHTPLPVKIGSAAPWFDEPGGGIQVQTDASAAQLVADGVLLRVPTNASPCGS